MCQLDDGFEWDGTALLDLSIDADHRHRRILDQTCKLIGGGKFHDVGADHANRMVVDEAVIGGHQHLVAHAVGLRQARDPFRIIAGNRAGGTQANRGGAARRDDGGLRPGQFGDAPAGGFHQLVDIHELGGRARHGGADLRTNQASPVDRADGGAIDERTHAQTQIRIVVGAGDGGGIIRHDGLSFRQDGVLVWRICAPPSSSGHGASSGLAASARAGEIGRPPRFRLPALYRSA